MRVSIVTLAGIVGISQQAVSRLADDGVIKRGADGKLDRDEAVRAY